MPSPETRMIVLPVAEDRMIVSSFVWTKHRNVTDGETNRSAMAITALCIVRTHCYKLLHVSQIQKNWGIVTCNTLNNNWKFWQKAVGFSLKILQQRIAASTIVFLRRVTMIQQYTICHITWRWCCKHAHCITHLLIKLSSSNKVAKKDMSIAEVAVSTTLSWLVTKFFGN